MSSNIFLAPGYKFVPTDEVLLAYYLTNHASIEQQQQQFFCNSEGVVECGDVYRKHPWDLAKDDKDASHRLERDGALYFFVHMTKKNANGCRPNRQIPNMGFWKATSSGKEVVDHHGKVIGVKRNLVYHEFKDDTKTSSKDGSKTSWIMYEYHLVDPNKNPDDDKKEFQEWVLCRISNSGRVQPSSNTTSGSTSSVLEAAALSSDHDDRVPWTSTVPCFGGHPAATDQTLTTTLHHQQQLGQQKQHPELNDEAAYSMVSIDNETNQVVEVEEDSSMFESLEVVHQYMTTASLPFGEECCSYNIYSDPANTSSVLEAAALSSDHDDHRVPWTSTVPCFDGHPAATDQTLTTTLHHQQQLGQQKQHPELNDEAAYSMVSIDNETNQVVEVEEDSSMFESLDVHQYMTTASLPFGEECCSYNIYSDPANTSSVLEAAALSSDHDDRFQWTSTVPCFGGHPAATDQTLSTSVHHQQLLGKRKHHQLTATDDEAAYSTFPSIMKLRW